MLPAKVLIPALLSLLAGMQVKDAIDWWKGNNQHPPMLGDMVTTLATVGLVSYGVYTLVRRK